MLSKEEHQTNNPKSIIKNGNTEIFDNRIYKRKKFVTITYKYPKNEDALSRQAAWSPKTKIQRIDEQTAEFESNSGYFETALEFENSLQ